MHEVIKVYGKTILQAIILVGVMWLVFRGVTDENGNKGIVEIVSGHMDRQTDKHRHSPFAGASPQDG